MIVLLVSCTTEEELSEFSLTTLNSSNESLTIEIYDIGGLFQSVALEPNSMSECNYSSRIFRGFSQCNNSERGIDSVIIRFQNGKGYCCKSSLDNVFCLAAKELFVNNPETFEQLGEREYRFTITQEDFDNAFDLPE